MQVEDKFKEEREHLIENFLVWIKGAKNLEDLGVKTFSTSTAMGLTFDNERRGFIKAKFVNIHLTCQTFTEFNLKIINSFREYLETQIK